MVDRKEIEKLYTQEGFEYRPTAQDRNEAEFYDRVEDKNIRHRLDKVVRTKVPGGKEYILYKDTLITEDQLGNKLNFTSTDLRGKYQKPQFSYEWDQETRKKKAKDIVGHKTEYEIPFSKENMQKVLDINTEEDANTQFVLIVGANSRHTGFDADEFLNRSFDELVAKATTGKYPEKKPQQQQPQKEIKEVKKGLIAEKEVVDEKGSSSEEERKYAAIVRAVDEETQTPEEEESEPQQQQQKKSSFGKKSGRRF